MCKFGIEINGGLFVNHVSLDLLLADFFRVVFLAILLAICILDTGEHTFRIRGQDIETINVFHIF